MWEETKHPRDGNGMFTEKSGEGANANKGKGIYEMTEEDRRKVAELNKQLESAHGLFARAALMRKIDARENGFGDDVEAYMAYEAEKRKKALEDYEKAKQKRLEFKKNNDNRQNKEEYMMAHRPTESGITADDLTNQNVETPMPSDFYDTKYFDMNDEATRECVEAVSKVRGDPNAKIKIYRATVGDSINDGDWVTLSKKYAETHNAHSLEGKGRILEMEVSAKDIQFAGDDIREWGYFPKDESKKQFSSFGTK